MHALKIHILTHMNAPEMNATTMNASQRPCTAKQLCLLPCTDQKPTGRSAGFFNRPVAQEAKSYTVFALPYRTTVFACHTGPQCSPAIQDRSCTVRGREVQKAPYPTSHPTWLRLRLCHTSPLTG